MKHLGLLWSTMTSLRRIAVALEQANRLEKYRQELEFKKLPESTADPAKKKVIISRANYS